MKKSMFLLRQPTSVEFRVGLIFLWVAALGLRFWGLERFNTLVFDEIYFAKFAHNYLTHTTFFDAHPPLGKYLIAVGIWLKGFYPWGYRWMNALVGSCIPILVASLGYQLTGQRRVALLAGFLTLLDGLLLVESRYGLINVYLLFFGLLGQCCVLLSSRQHSWSQWGWLTLAGLSFGATAAVKWTGLGFLLGLYLFWGLQRLGNVLGRKAQPSLKTPLAALQKLSVLQLLFYIPCVGALLYRIIWIPHLLQNPEFDFWQVHQQMWIYHKQVGSGPDIHPYCSTGLTWPLMLRPVSYFYQVASSLQEGMPMTGPPLPNEKVHYIYTVYAIGNPFLWWGTTAAITTVVGLLLWRTARWLLNLGTTLRPHRDCLVPLFLSVNYAASLLPWLRISRCAFLYHYMPAYLFSSIALAWVLENCLRGADRSRPAFVLSILLLCLVSFLFWLPFYLGLPLSLREWQWRIWLPTWV
jgi:dolichyl-phosphate-mannose--protein O-mannosyl transferase